MAKKGSYIVTKPTGAELRAVKNYIVDKIIRWAQEEGHCETVEEALNAVFGTAPANGWRDSDGYNCYGYDTAGWNAEGYNSDGWNAQGYNGHGYNAAGYNAEGYDRYGFDQNGYDWEGYNRQGYNAEGVNKNGEKADRLQAYLATLTPADQRELYGLLRNNLRAF